MKLKNHQSVLRATQPHKEPMHHKTPSIEKFDFGINSKQLLHAHIGSKISFCEIVVVELAPHQWNGKRILHHGPGHWNHTWFSIISNKLVCAHRVCHPLPTLSFCAVRNVASTLEIGRDFTLKQDGLLHTLVAIHLRVSGFAVCAVWPPDAKSESNSPLQHLNHGPGTPKFSLK